MKPELLGIALSLCAQGCILGGYDFDGVRAHRTLDAAPESEPDGLAQDGALHVEMGDAAPGAEPEPDGPPEPDADSPDTQAEPDAQEPDTGSPGVDAEADNEACVPDTCEAHGYVCDRMPDGCGGFVQCGSTYWCADDKNTSEACAIYGKPFSCVCDTIDLSSSAPPGLPPMPGCVHQGLPGAIYMWCCPHGL